MDQETVVAEIEARAKALGVPMYRICADAGVAPSTPSRWKSGVSLNLATLAKLQEALAAREADAPQSAAA